MLTPDFSSWKTKVTIASNNKDKAKPAFQQVSKQYNALGGERQDIKKSAPGAPGAPPV